MSQQADQRPHQVGLFLSPAAPRREDFQAACGARFARLLLADSAAQAAAMLAQQPVSLLVIDLDGFDRGLDLAALGRLVALRAGAPVLLVCPYASAGWLPALMASGPVAYAIGPLDQAELDARLAAPAPGQPARQGDLPELLAAGAALQQALAATDDPGRLAAQACAVLAGIPGVLHAALFQADQGGEVELEAQHSPLGFDLAPLLQPQLRHAFPGFLAVASGELALLDAPEKAGLPELAVGLRGEGVEMVLGLPFGGAGPAPRGAVCLMFECRQEFSKAELDALATLAQLAGIGLRMAALQRDGEHLRTRLTWVASVDALTGVANRRRGEELLEQEIRRARRYKAPVALIGFDVDDFKAVNDRFGHACGDTALRTVAEATQAALRSSDVLVRSGGGEFQIVAPHTSAIDALKMAEKVRLAIAHTAMPGCDQLTVSLGVAQAGEHESGDALIVRVNAALARAKRAGRNCVELAMQ